MNATKAIQLIWDFRGPEAQRTAAHYKQHLLEFLEGYADRCAMNEVGMKENQEFWHSCTLVIDPEQLSSLKHKLKPHRAIYL